MKKRALCFLLTALLIFTFSITGFAFGDIEVENIYDSEIISESPEHFDVYAMNNIETKELFLNIPHDYSYMQEKEQSQLLYYIDSDYEDSISVFCVPNKGLNAGTLTEEKAESIIGELLIYGYYEYTNYTIAFYKSGTEKINGVTAFTVCGDYTNNEYGYTYGLLAYILTTGENLYLIAFEDYDEEFDNYDDVNEVMKSCCVYGTNISGSCTVKNPYESASSFEDFSIQAYNDYSDNFSENIIDSEFGLFGDTDEYFSYAVIGFVILGFLGLIITGLTVAVIILAVLNSKKKKIIKEYEQKMYSYNTYNPAFQPQMPAGGVTGYYPANNPQQSYLNPIPQSQNDNVIK